MKKLNKTVSKILFSGILLSLLLLVGSCENWMSNDNFMEQIESEVHDANAAQVSVYVRNASTKMGSTEPSGNVTMKVDVASKISTIPSEDYGFFKWAAFSTNDFPTNKQHNNLTFISEEDYNENYKSKELPSSIVHFANPKSATTEVKILSSRSDIFIVPIVTERPSYVQSIPAEGEKNVVLNTSIRILFSKPIDENTLHDEEGFLNYSITSSSSSGGMGDDDSDLEIKDITDLFDYKLNSSGKMLSLTLKENIDKNGIKVKELLDPRQTISINLLEGICDRYGYAMKGNYKFNFKTGVDSDSIAPYIDILVGGTGDICDVFVSFHNEEKWNGKATEAAKKAPKDINSSEYDDKLLAQRVYDKINLYVRAEDIIGTDDTDVDIGTNTDEDNVNYVVIEASLMVDSDGKPVTVDTSIPKKNIMYIPGTLDSKSGINKLFSEIVPLGENGKRRKDGTIFSYDVSSLPDGLIKINVWAIDMTGNSGGPNDLGAPNIAKHDNGYKSIFVVKDTTPIDSAEVKAKKQVISNSDKAPYYWYNKETLNTMELFDSPENKIHDAGHAKLRALDKNLWWTFRVGDVSEKIAANDSSWKRIHDETDGTSSIHYSLKDAKAPSKDGPVDITLYLKDDLGNMSEPVLLDSIMYDNTAPSVTLKSGKGDFVNATGKEELHASDLKVIEQILKVTIDESNENETGSGIRRMEIHVKKGNEEVEIPLDASTLKVLYAPSSIVNPTPSSEGIRTIKIQNKEADSATTNNIKVFDVTDADKITNGTLFIYGLTLGDADGIYEVNVDLYDSALNKTPVTAITKIARDTTEPVINKVQVLGAKARKVYNQEEETWWLPYDQFEDANNLTKVTLKISANESGSGLKYIKLADNAEFTENTILYVGDTALTRDEDYTLYTSTRTIELKNWDTPKLINSTNGEHIITLENIKLNNINAPAGTTQGNKIHLTLDDFVEKSKSNDKQIYYDETTSTGTLVYADSIAPKIAYLHIADSVKHTENNPDDMGYNGDNYTDSQNVVLTLTFADTESGNKGSGINQVILSDNAEFTSGTKIYYKNADNSETLLTTPKDYEITTDTVTFKKVFTETDTLRFTNVKIVSDIQGEQSIKADVQDFAGIKSAESKPANVIIYDSVNPSLYQVYWVADDNTVTAGNANGNVINNQTLRIEFTEETAGVKVIQLDIKQNENDTSYETPFDSSSLTLSYEYAGTKNLTKGVDYEVQGKYIILNKTYTSGAFNIKGITLKNAVDEVSYTVNVTLLDASENKDSNSTFIAIDITAPEFTDYIRIPDLKRTVELISSGTSATVDGYWLAKTQVNGSNKAADNIPVYIKIREKSSGIKVIEFAENAILSSDTTLWLVDGTSETQVNSTIYTVDTNTNKITIKDEADSRRLFARADDSEFELLVKNVGFNKADSENEASYNTIKAYLSDVAKMRDENGKTTAEPGIYTDSRAPNAPTDLTLKDRKTTSTTIAASDGYTDESVIDMTFNLDDSEQFGSGYHQFVLDGATFIKTGADATTLKLKDINGIEIPNVDFEISSDNRTLTLKRTNQASETYTVVRQAVTVELKNIELDNQTANENHTVSVTAYDLTGWSAETVSAIIMLDTKPPVLEKPVFTAAFTREGSAYNATLNVYPHPDGENGKGVSRTFGEKTIPTFYTKAKVDDNDPTYNVVLGIRAKDNIILRGNESSTTFLYYIEDNSFSKNVADILAGEKINPETGINGNRAQQTCLWFKFPVGKYSAVIADEAGNISSVFHFNVEADETVPAVNDFADHVLFEQPNDDSDVYRNAVPASTAAGEFTYSTETPSTSLVSRKYVTKKSGDKYRIVLNLGNTYTSDNTSAIVKKLDGADAADALNYAELSAAVNQAPIEKYAIVTNYTTWPSSTDATDYAAVIPDLTDTLWHNYTAGQKVTDSGNSIVSWIDSNKNLVLELPNTQSTAPITVLVRDGCGNYNSVLLGYDSTSKTAVSYIVDGKLGTKAAENGTITEPVIIQNPYMTTPNNSSDRYTWKNADDNTETVYDWNAQSGNTDKSNSGVGQKRGFIKDFVKKATYYNPALNTNPFKIGLVLRVSTDNQETVLFNESGKTTDSTDYTARAMIYCTIDESVPTRETIINATSQSSGVTGFNTGWVNVKAKQNEDNKIVILLDYPTPDYTTLGWTVNETNGEPKPYFIWYLFEDRIGNYEIAKVVNSAGSGTQLNQAYSADSSVFDRWLYDNEAPKLTIRGTTTDPSTITADNINDLVATNNGFVPYVKSNGDGTSTVYVHAEKVAQQSGETLNNNLGTGTTHKYDSDSNKSIYNPFVDLQVAEITGVRAFTWSNFENDVSFDTSYSDSNYWYNDTSVKWYIGYGSISSSDGGLAKDIGKPHTYYGEPYALNAYFDKEISSNYYDSSAGTKPKYSGIKVNTIFPKAKMATEKELWLHVMDWTGNISHYRMGQNIKFINDSTAPSYSSTNGEELEPNQYYMKKTEDSEIPLVRFAGTGADAVAENNINVYLPESYFAESGSGVKGYSFKNDGTGIAVRDAKGLYLSVPYEKYSASITQSSMTYYVYDNVGNRTSKTLNYVFDADAPDILNVSIVEPSSFSTSYKFCDPEHGLIGNAKSYSDINYYYDYTFKDVNGTNLSTPINKPHDDVEHFASGELQEVYFNKTEIARFHVNLSEACPDITQIQVNRWKWTNSSDHTKGGSWVTFTGWKRDSAADDTTWHSIGETSTKSDWTGDSTSVNFIMSANNLTYEKEGTYYQILATDISGNSSFRYFKLYLDNEAPTFVENQYGYKNPVIELGKGSINPEPNSTTNYYYTADANGKLKIKFAVEDSGSGSKASLKQFEYSFNRSTGWTSVPSNNQIEFTEGTYEFFYLKDILGNITEVANSKPYFTYHYNDGSESGKTEQIPKLTKYTVTTKPTAPTITPIELKYSTQDISIVKEIETYGKGYYYYQQNNRWYRQWNSTEDWTLGYTEKLKVTGSNTILIKENEYAPRKKLRITFTPTENIIGYLELDENETPSTAVGAYSFADTSKMKSFESNLPMKEDYGLTTKKYYAVDVVGNLSDPFTVKYTYENPHSPKNVELIKDPENSGMIADDVLNTMKETYKIKFARFLDVEESPKDPNSKTGRRYISDGYLVLRCTLPEKASTSYAETPERVQLFDGWVESGKQKRYLRGETSVDTGFMALSSSTDTDKDSTGRYYCYIAFKLPVTTEKDGNGSNDNPEMKGMFYNNTDYDGSVIYAKVFGSTSESELTPLNESEKARYGWMIDNEAPQIYSDCYTKENEVIYLNSQTGLVVGAPVLDEQGNEIIEDKKLKITQASKVKNKDGNYSNLYPINSIAFIPVRHKISNDKYQSNFSDNFTDEVNLKYKFVTSTEDSVEIPSPDSTGWNTFPDYSGVNGAGRRRFVMPPVNTPGTIMALFLKDEVGNVTKPFYLADKPDGSDWIKTWIVDESPSTVKITEDGKTTLPEYSEEEGKTYDINVAMNKGAIIKSISAVNAEVDSVVFNDEADTAWTIQPTYDANSGTFGDSYINLKSVKVTLKTLTAPIWTGEQSVKLKINGSEIGGTVITIPVKKLSEGDIELKQVVSEQEQDLPDTISTRLKDDDTRTVRVKLGNGAKASRVNKITISGAKIKSGSSSVTEIDASSLIWDNEETTTDLVLTNIDQDWTTEKNVKLTFTPTVATSQTATTFDKDVFTVGKKPLQYSDITFSLPTNFVNGAENTIKLETASDVILSRISKVTLVDGTKEEEQLYPDTSSSTTTSYSYKKKIYKEWASRSVKLKIYDTLEGNIIEQTIFDEEVPAIGSGDITVTGDSDYTVGKEDYEYEISIPGITLGESDISHEGDEGFSWISATGETTAKVKITAKRGWTDKTVILKVRNFTVRTLNITAPTESEIKEGVTGDSAYSNTKKTYEYSIDITGITLAATDVTYSGVDESDFTFTPADETNPAKVTMVIERDWDDDKTITLSVNGTQVRSLNVSKIEASEITVTGDNAYDSEKTTYTYKIIVPGYTLKAADVTAEGVDEEIEFTAANETEPAKVTLTVKQNWTNDKAVLKVKGNTVKELTRIAKTLGEGDINIPPAEVPSNGTEPVSSITFNNGATSANIESISVSCNSTEWTKDTDYTIFDIGSLYMVTLKSIPEATWSKQEIKITINENISKVVLAVEPKALGVDDVTIGDAEIVEGVPTVELTFKNEASVANVSGVSADHDVTATLDTTTGKVTLTDLPAAGWSAIPITLTINGNSELSKVVYEVPAKELTYSDFTITATNGTWAWPPAGNDVYYFPITITPAEGVAFVTEEKDGKNVPKVSVDTGSIEWSDGNKFGIKPANGETISGDLKITITAKAGETGTGKEITFSLTNVEDGKVKAPGAANNPRSIFGIRSGAIAYNSTATETAGDAPKTRRVSLTSWVSDLFNNDSEVAAETVKDEVKSTTAKAAKKAKKAQKAAAAKVEKAPVEKPVVTETVETVAVTSAAAVSEVVETVVETVADEGTVATVEEAVPEAKVSMTAVDASVTESVADDQAQSGAILWLALAALCAAVVGIVVLFLKNRAAKK